MSGMLLRVQTLGLRRGERGVLAEVTFEVPRGELVALMGPSGSGKTTILRVIAGLEPFQSGTVQVEDLAIDSGAWITPTVLRALQRKVGMVFQFHHLFEHLPAIKNVWLAPVHAYGVPLRDAERRARELLAALGVEHRATALPRELSGGEAQRVAIARALAVDPPLLLMDEPTASLDPARRMELRDLLQGLLRDGRTLIVATHDEEFARGCASRVLRVIEGRVFEER
ncbi:MAG TPA: ATP-binding cassette domain-containing protein, partial [Candidatus Binatia bacterium]|nr:ATP-binding cassette domain-containing protein [Candidatus Binatia bacterium]